MSDASRLPYGHGRRAMLDATIEVVAQSGLRGLTYRAVAERAGVNNSLVAHHFGSRDGLVVAALEHATELTLAAFAASWSEDRPLADDLVDRLIGPAEALQMFQYELLLESRRTPSLRPALVRQYDAYIDAWHDMLTRLGLNEDRAFARAVSATVDGLLLQRLTIAEPTEVSAAVARLRALIESRMRSPEAT